VESSPNIENQIPGGDVVDQKLEEQTLATQSVLTTTDNVESETLKTRQINENNNEIESFLDFFRHSYSLKGKQISISDKTVKKIEEKRSNNNDAISKSNNQKAGSVSL
jgi:hypothetical protein